MAKVTRTYTKSGTCRPTIIAEHSIHSTTKRIVKGELSIEFNMYTKKGEQIAVEIPEDELRAMIRWIDSKGE